jgi:hypothetical protein
MFLLLGNSGKPVTLETSSLTKFLRYVFQGQGIYDFQESGSSEASGSRTRDFSGILNLRSLRFANMQFSGILNRRSLGVVNMRKSGISNRRSHKLRRTADSGIFQKSGSEVVQWEIHEPVRSKVKVVVSKSLCLECELVAGL